MQGRRHLRTRVSPRHRSGLQLRARYLWTTIGLKDAYHEVPAKKPQALIPIPDITESLVARATAVTICTTKPDKYDRHLANVFLTTGGDDVFLNNALLENRHAVVKRAWEFSDWGE